ncbi:MAG: Lrp/AsnC ligand binding domain-containing protein [Paludibacteraceae bacterium]|nr:Lrp/AsnC ligand binding domain-containing protein [Paludibacteraceae bacterium]
MGHHRIDKLDEKILKLISGNARIPFLEVARECNVSGAAIHQRIQKLQNIGVIKGSEFVLDATKIGYNTCAFMGIFLKDANLFKSVANELSHIPEVVECHYTTGKYAMFIKIYAKNNMDFLRIIQEKLQPINGISSTETIISLNEGFKRQAPIMSDEFDEIDEAELVDEEE